MFGKKKKHHTMELYSVAEEEAITQYIEETFGAIDSVFHEIVSMDVHIDINAIFPNEKNDHYTLITTGMGAHHMNVPKDFRKYGMDRIELLITLPSSWELNNTDEQWYWPIRWLKELARLPIANNTWLGYGHTVQTGGPVAENAHFCSFMLYPPLIIAEDTEFCKLPNGERIVIYQLIPLYENEMEYKIENGAEALEEHFPAGYNGVVDINRPAFI
ncbi:suppressor of fused domain protein [Eubacteriales bacterium OttesenSCG-928-N14]|nr:suppressor of fused domain protein [Eubacteriales bacterium OttesenSCG-928-N14]